jgi:hypothetical protein
VGAGPGERPGGLRRPASEPACGVLLPVVVYSCSVTRRAGLCQFSLSALTGSGTPPAAPGNGGSLALVFFCPNTN